MKRIISSLLAAMIAVSGITALGFTAVSAATEDEKTVYLVGDANLDGTVSIGDVTSVQRQVAEAENFSGLQTALAQVDGNPLSIETATLIQKQLAEVGTGLPIGQPAGDGNEGVVYSENVVGYVSPDGDTILSVDSKLYFSTAYPDVAFVSDTYLMELFSEAYYYSAEDITVITGESAHTYTLPNGTSVTFDYGGRQLVFSDYTTFITPNDTVPFHAFSIVVFENAGLYKIDSISKYYGGDPSVLSFDYSEIPMLRSGGDILIPLQTFSDFFLAPCDYFLQYNGKSLYTLMPNAEEFSPGLWKQYLSETVKKEQISSALAQVNYYELCANLGARYGLCKAHGIDDFDSYFSRRKLREEFLSGNVERIEKANKKIGPMLFEDFHSNSCTASPFLDGDIEEDDSDYSPIYLNRQINMEETEEIRRELLGEEIAPYERRGDTVFITFDSFVSSNYDVYYQDGFEPSPDSGDTIQLFAYALRRLQNEDSDVRNVVVDIACNDGGTADTCGYVLDALIGNCIICMQNPNTSALSQYLTKFDLNLDGVIDDNDKSMKKMGKNIAVIMTDGSFSCGNLLPCALNALDDNVLLLGQQSGGGACAVGFISTAIGSVMQISSERMLVTMKNGNISDIDAGVAPKIALSKNRMFDRDYVVDAVNDYFG